MAKATARARINTKAENLFLRGGYEKTSLNEIVEAAGLSKGAFFHYYKGKNEMALDVIRNYAEGQFFAPLDKHLTAGHKVKDALFLWIEEIFLVYKADEFRGGCLLGNFALELSDRDEEARELLKKIFLHLENQLVGYLKPLEREGKLLMESRQLARLIIISVQGATLTIKVHKDAIRGSREFQSIAQIIEQMIHD